MSTPRARSFARFLAFGIITLGACTDANNGPDPDPSLAMTLTPASGSVIKGNTAQTAAVVTRTDYTGDLTITVEGLPTGVTAAVGTPETSGNVTTALVTLTTTAAAATGDATLTVRAHGGGVTDVTKPYALSITAPPVNNTVTLDLSGCTNKPIWLAAQDGSGAFQRVIPTADVYTFQLEGARGSVVTVQSSGAGYNVNLATYDRTKWLTGTPLICNMTGLSVAGTLAGVTPGTTGTLAFSSGSSLSRSSNGAITINSLRPGTYDISAFLRGVATDASADRLILRRGQSITTSGDLGTLDLAGSESIAAATAPITITGMVAGEEPSLSMYYHTMAGGRCGTNAFGFRVSASATIVGSGVPAAQQLATDYHEAFVAATATNGDYRGVGAIFHTLAAKTVPLPTALPTPTILFPTGTVYRRPQVSFTLPSEYAGEVLLQFSQTGGVPRSMQMRVQTTLIAGQPLTVAIPDLSAVSGWDNSWGLSSGTGGTWNFYAYSDASTCTEGNRSAFSLKSGAY